MMRNTAIFEKLILPGSAGGGNCRSAWQLADLDPKQFCPLHYHFAFNLFTWASFYGTLEPILMVFL